jgi:hypothetical protein
MSGATMVVKLKQILDKFSFTQKILVYVKDEDSNLQTCVQAFKLVVSCGDFGIVEHLMALVIDMHYQRYVNMPFQMKKWLIMH